MENGIQNLIDMSEAIKQNGNCILCGNKGSLQVIFNNLIGKNFQGDTYQNYLKNVAFKGGFQYGDIQFYSNEKLIEVGTIKNNTDENKSIT